MKTCIIMTTIRGSSSIMGNNAQKFVSVLSTIDVVFIAPA